jgi:DNA-binding transcriptional MerR regulator
MDLLTKKYYTIGEVAEMFGFATSLLRYWEKHFQQLRPKTCSRGVRKYTLADIEQIKRIQYLIKEQGYTIRGAQSMLRTQQSSPTSVAQLINSLKGMKDFLKVLKDQL